MTLEHLTIDELQRRGAGDTEAMTELGRRFVDIDDPTDIEDTLAGYKLQMEACLSDVAELRGDMIEARDDVNRQFTELLEAVDRLETEMVEGES